ncbi:MAG: hypothetical protein NVS3B12_06240 [Acidimicrobiales bacterium]
MTISPPAVELPEPCSDEELSALALAADPQAPLADDAVSIWDVVGAGDDELLPSWYMPSPRTGTRRLTGWRRRVVVTLIVAFLLIDAAGLCSTYGAIVIA